MIEKFHTKLNSLLSGKTIKKLVVSADSNKALELANQPHNLPAIFVYPLAHNSSSPSDGPNLIGQKITHTIGVLVAIKQTNKKVTNLGADFDTLMTALKNTLFGWQPDGAFGAVTYGGGNFLVSEKSTLYFETRWSVDEQWRS